MSDELQGVMPIDDVIRALVEQYGLGAVRAAVECYRPAVAPLPETVSLDQMRADPHQARGRPTSPGEEPPSAA